MADIGRILLIPQGNYNSAVVYNMLDVVKHSATKASWVSKTDNNQGNTPVDGSNYWQKLCDDGVGIANVEQTTTSTDDYGENIITVTLTDGTTKTFSVRNGRKGSTGAAAGFGVCTASLVEDNVNLAPHVNVHASGSDTAKTFDFEFSNVNGSQWYRGTEISGGSSSSQVYPSSEVNYANINDCYINLTEGKVYQCTKGGIPSVAEWKYILTLSGGGGGGSSAWGDITGTLSNQTDLQNALNAKANASTTYSKTEVDSLLDDKADATDIIIDSVTSDLDITNKELGLATSITEKLVKLKSDGTLDADDVNYDNTTSGLTADNVQDAIDELVVGLNGKADSTDLDGWSNASTLASGNTVTFTGLNDSYGYKLYSVDDPNAFMISCVKTGSGTSMQLVYTVSGSNLQVGISQFKLRILK